MQLSESASQQDVVNFARQLFRELSETDISFEGVAQEITHTVFNTYRINDDPLFALVRVFRLMPRELLHPRLQDLSNDHYKYWIALMGTSGIEDDWNSRHTSRGHKVLNIQGDVSPMVEEVLSQLSIDPTRSDVNQVQTASDDGRPARTLFVQDVPGNPLIPAQDEFVKPYGINSVIGIGASFVDTTSYFMLCFSRISLDNEFVQNFAGMEPFISTILAKHNSPTPLWDD